jgi:hypothetical protein
LEPFPEIDYIDGEHDSPTTLARRMIAEGKMGVNDPLSYAYTLPFAPLNDGVEYAPVGYLQAGHTLTIFVSAPGVQGDDQVTVALTVDPCDYLSVR